jgi:hypothetical protein
MFYSFFKTILIFSEKVDDALYKIIQQDMKYIKNDTDVEENINEIH